MISSNLSYYKEKYSNNNLSVWGFIYAHKLFEHQQFNESLEVINFYLTYYPLHFNAHLLQIKILLKLKRNDKAFELIYELKEKGLVFPKGTFENNYSYRDLIIQISLLKEDLLTFQYYLKISKMLDPFNQKILDYELRVKKKEINFDPSILEPQKEKNISFKPLPQMKANWTNNQKEIYPKDPLSKLTNLWKNIKRKEKEL